jgi:hypothetical protein
MQEEEMLLQQSQINRSQYQSNVAGQINTNESVAAKYLGYDPDLRLAKLQDADGNIFYARPDTNGAIAVGDDIRLRGGYGMPGYDAMPYYKKQPTPSNPPNNDVLDAAILFMIRAGYVTNPLAINEPYSPYPVQQQINHSCNVVVEPTTLAQSIVFEDTFSTTFGSGGFLGGFLISYYFITASNKEYNPAISFISPTQAVITIEVSFSPGSGVINTYCGISVDRYTDYIYADYLEPGNQNPSTVINLDPSTCDAYSTGTSVSHTTTVPAGTHYVSIFAGYNHRNDVQSSTADGVLYIETVTGDVKITIQTIALASFYIQQGRAATKIADLNIADYTLISGDPAVLTGSFLTYAKSEIIAHLKTKTYVSNNAAVHRYLLSGTQVTESDFVPPQIIPTLDDDWQNPWTCSYYPELTSEDACINSVRSGATANFTNFYRNNIIVCSQQSTDQPPVPFTTIIKQDFNAQIQINSYSSQNNTCTLGGGKNKKLILRQLVIDPSINLSFVQILAISPFYSPR